MYIVLIHSTHTHTSIFTILYEYFLPSKCTSFCSRLNAKPHFHEFLNQNCIVLLMCISFIFCLLYPPHILIIPINRLCNFKYTIFYYFILYKINKMVYFYNCFYRCVFYNFKYTFYFNNYYNSSSYSFIIRKN